MEYTCYGVPNGDAEPIGQRHAPDAHSPRPRSGITYAET